MKYVAFVLLLVSCKVMGPRDGTNASSSGLADTYVTINKKSLLEIFDSSKISDINALIDTMNLQFSLKSFDEIKCSKTINERKPLKEEKLTVGGKVKNGCKYEASLSIEGKEIDPTGKAVGATSSMFEMKSGPVTIDIPAGTPKKDIAVTLCPTDKMRPYVKNENQCIPVNPSSETDIEIATKFGDDPTSGDLSNLPSATSVPQGGVSNLKQDCFKYRAAYPKRVETIPVDAGNYWGFFKDSNQDGSTIPYDVPSVDNRYTCLRNIEKIASVSCFSICTGLNGLFNADTAPIEKFLSWNFRCFAKGQSSNKNPPPLSAEVQEQLRNLNCVKSIYPWYLYEADKKDLNSF